MEITLSSLVPAKKEAPKAKLHGFAVIMKDENFNEIGVVVDFNRQKAIDRAYALGANMVSIYPMEDYNYRHRMDVKAREINEMYE